MTKDSFGDVFYNTLITIKEDSFIFAEPVSCLMILNDLGYITEETYTKIGLFLEKVKGTSLGENEKRPNYEEVITFIYDNLLEDELLLIKLSSDITDFDDLLLWMNDNVKLGWNFG
ncbi:MAG: hypothetical protein IJT72_07255 [Lachnospiraceae bacterium]|nr:hypothetical protein [Lachnospiraceae bacterium]